MRCGSRRRSARPRLRAPQRIRASRREAREHPVRRRPCRARRLRRRTRLLRCRCPGHEVGLAVGTPEYMSRAGERRVGARPGERRLQPRLRRVRDARGEPPSGARVRGRSGEAGDRIASPLRGFGRKCARHGTRSCPRAREGSEPALHQRRGVRRRFGRPRWTRRSADDGHHTLDRRAALCHASPTPTTSTSATASPTS